MTKPISGVVNGGPEAHERFGQVREAALGAAAKALGESIGDLKSQLGSGKSLGALAQAKGVSTDDLQKAIRSAVKQANSQATDDQAAEIARRMATAHHHHHQPQTPPEPRTPPFAPDTTFSVKA